MQVTSLLNVSDERVSATTSYFRSAGAHVVVAPNRDMLTVTMPVSTAETLLKMQLHWFKHSTVANARRILRSASGYSLDDAIAPHVLLVGELVQFPRVTAAFADEVQAELVDTGSYHKTPGRSTRQPEAWPQGCDAIVCTRYVTPAVIASRYKLPGPTDPSMLKVGSSGTSMAVAEFQGQYYKVTDLQNFGKSCHVPDVSINRTIGGDLPIAGVESELDIEYIKAVAPSVPLTVVYNTAYSLLQWTNQISSLEDPPLVHSVSYGNDEAQQSSEEYMAAANTAFMKAGVRGLSILFASGDQVCIPQCGLNWQTTPCPRLAVQTAATVLH